MAGLKNDFSEDIRFLFSQFPVACYNCGINYPLELHHVLKRVSNSPLNGSLVCHDCHEKGTIHYKHNQEELLRQTFYNLIVSGYELSTKDFLFIESYPHFTAIIASFNDKNYIYKAKRHFLDT